VASTAFLVRIFILRVKVLLLSGGLSQMDYKKNNMSTAREKGSETLLQKEQHEHGRGKRDYRKMR
jgi:hypothetical protein